MTITVNMPQMCAGGLSENWLFKFCGDLHWQRLCDSLSTSSARLVSDAGGRLYASFVAISARYSRPLHVVQENDVLEESASLARYGSSFFHGVVRLAGAGVLLQQEMVTAFVSRTAEGRNELRKGVPAPRFVYQGESEAAAPWPLTRWGELRKQLLARYPLDGEELDLAAPPLGLDAPYAPNPYVDYNGANLLYYAAYPSIVDGAERRLIHAHHLVEGLERDWALAAATRARDVFYYRNLDLGEAVVVRLQHLVRTGARVTTHSVIRRESDGEAIAELFTTRELAT